ncbi:MAG: cupin domain-containing protein [Ignavibacteriales bacterium]|nr:MAG: cupin domain-containing protein [Ignavibacteriales bacterium]
MNAKEIIKILELEKHPEGGYFREVYRSRDEIDFNKPGQSFEGKRNISTSIYFLLEGNDISKLHRIKSDELWHHYSGSSVRLFLIDLNGNISQKILGKNIQEGELFQLTIDAGLWFCAEPINKDSYTLVGCTVAPGFDFKDFELGSREHLLKIYPMHRELIERFT